MASSKPVLNQLNLVARDFGATLAFYRRLGLDVPSGSTEGGVRHSEVTLESGFTLEFDDEKLASIYNAAWREPGGSSRALLGVRVATREEVDARYAELVEAGYQGRQVPYDTFFGARYAVVADPDGHDVGIMSPQDDAKRSWPPANSPDK